MEEMNDYLRLSIMENNINNNQEKGSAAAKWKQKIFKRYLFRNNDLFLLVQKGTTQHHYDYLFLLIGWVCL